MATKNADRRLDIDWLRVFATYILFVFHGALIFSPAPFFHVRNHEVAPFMMVLTGFISLWHMPLFFLLAGWSLHGSLAERGAAGFVRERLLRLGLPLVIGSATIGPLVKFFELKSGLDLNAHGLRVAADLQDTFKLVAPQGFPVAPPFRETFWEFLPSFYTTLDRFTWAHLWFLAYLLVFSLLYLPLFTRALRSPRLSEPLRSAFVYLPIVPLAIIQVVLRPYWPGVQNLYDDWANFAYYSTYLIVGFLLARHPGFEAAVIRERRRALIASVAVMLVLLLALLRVFDSQTVLLAGSAVAGWCAVVALLGYARVLLSDARRGRYGIDYLREAAFPVYILHQPALVVIGFAVVGTSLGIATKFVLIVVASLLVVQASYHAVVRYSPALRLIYGMKPMVPRTLAAGAAVTMALLLVAAVSHAASVNGTWWIEGGAAKVEIEECEEGLCGRVAWLRSPFDEYGCELRDRRNPEPQLRERPVIGLRVLTGLRREQSTSGQWTGGMIYDPESGYTYRCTLTLDDPDSLELRGYIGIPLIGRTSRWTRVGSEGEQCRMRSQLSSTGEDGGR